MNNEETKNRLKNILTDKPSDWLAKTKLRKENRSWLDRSAKIAVYILQELKSQNISQKDLADKIGVSPQYINKIVKGQENLSLKTIGDIEKALGASLLTIFDSNIDFEVNPLIFNYNIFNYLNYPVIIDYQVPNYIPVNFLLNSNIDITETINIYLYNSDNKIFSDITDEMSYVAAA